MKGKFKEEKEGDSIFRIVETDKKNLITYSKYPITIIDNKRTCLRKKATNDLEWK